ncbi:hypothetical protein MBLNU457_7485t1 [Dothideomycetes sp. NU457]
MIDPSIRLRRAIYLKDAALLRRILKANPGLLENPDFEEKSNTSLHTAAKEGLVEIAEILLDAGHDAEEVSRNADWDTPLILAAANGQVNVGTLLINRCPRCIHWTNKKGLDVLAIACQTPASTPLIPLLIQHPTFPASVHARDNDGNTPLHHASASGSLKALRILLTAGADPSATNAFNWTPLTYSQTVAAEVYFKNLIAEFNARQQQQEEDRHASVSSTSTVIESTSTAPPISSPPAASAEKSTGERERKGGAVRLITDESINGERPGSSGGESANARSPVQTRRAMTPTATRAQGWHVPGSFSNDGVRARAASNE